MVVQLLRSRCDAIGEQLAHDEAQVHIAREMPSNCRGAHLGRVRWGNDNEHAQNEASEQLADEEHTKGPREELDEDEAGREDNAHAKRTLAPKPVHGIRSKDGTDDLSDGISHREACLP